MLQTPVAQLQKALAAFAAKDLHQKLAAPSQKALAVSAANYLYQNLAAPLQIAVVSAKDSPFYRHHHAAVAAESQGQGLG